MRKNLIIIGILTLAITLGISTGVSAEIFGPVQALSASTSQLLPCTPGTPCGQPYQLPNGSDEWYYPVYDEDCNCMGPTSIPDNDCSICAESAQSQSVNTVSIKNCTPGTPCGQPYQLPGSDEWYYPVYDEDCNCMGPTSVPGDDGDSTDLESEQAQSVECLNCTPGDQCSEEGYQLPGSDEWYYPVYDENCNCMGPTSIPGDDGSSNFISQLLSDISFTPQSMIIKTENSLHNLQFGLLLKLLIDLDMQDPQ